MIFQRLRLSGFKSFCDPVDLYLEPGLTGVVGPNGCGKSNLMEAMRWVMGESSYKAMRATGMDDVIFSGSAGRPGRNFAEVTLFLDNSDRTAPPAFNDADMLEVSRRIERENGSVYRVNGKDVRARDVQLLFADASTGAHSPALVRQGQIGELVNAKPVKRRALLEEAAGISGLYSRRHEAELRLKGAENNLERVDDIIAQVEGQVETLKRQSRQAVRYRNISGDIRRAEAALFHVRWVASRVAEKEAQAVQARLITQLAEAKHQELESRKALEAAEAALVPLREEEARAGAGVQRLKILREQLENEIERMGAQQQDLNRRLKQVNGDVEREARLVQDSEQALEQYEVERAALVAETEDSREGLDALKERFATSRALLEEKEKTFRVATARLAQARADRAQAQRLADDARKRAERLTIQIADVDAEAQKLGEQLDQDAVIGQRTAELAAAKEASARAEEEAVAAEADVQAAQGALEKSRPHLRELAEQTSRLEAEAETLARVLNIGDNELWPAIVDALEVTPGYEVALGAALGDDLEASSDDGAPIYWARPGNGDNDPSLPAAATPLSRFVRGVDSLKRTLDQIGIVEAEQGAELMVQLETGQRLVSLQGDLWRWDGLVAKADAPSPAAQRISQRNRLAELDGEVGRAREALRLARQESDTLQERLRKAQEKAKACQQAWRDAQHQISRSQNLLDVAQKAVGDLVTRQSALEEARVRLGSSLEEAEQVRTESEQALAQMPLPDDVANEVAIAEQQLAEARERADNARVSLSNFEHTQRMRTERLAGIKKEMAGWQKRKAGALSQLEALRTRAQEIDRQIKALAALPDDSAQKRAALDDKLEEARLAHKAHGDRLAEADTHFRQMDRASREAANVLGKASAEMARIDERLKGLVAQRQQIEQMVQESLGIPATETARVAGIKPESPLPDAAATEKKLERLKAERERLGGVNLSAEKELEDVSEKLDVMVRDKEDLIAAISKLRTGISSLNREGRARLTEAFDKVNTHFSDLFETLFGGGSAELTFVESDDPLEAGLEIMARPPGKKAQSLSLLSGGEQALTAMALIFAVFLTNPAPICVLDEVDAPLDDANVERFCTLLDSMRARTRTRFLVITHNPITMARMNRLFGVTMAERGVSQLVSVDLATAQAVQASA